MDPINPAKCMTAEDTAIVFSGPTSRLTMLDGDYADSAAMEYLTEKGIRGHHRLHAGYGLSDAEFDAAFFRS